MRLNLMALDEGYVNCIEKGHHVPMKSRISVGAEDDGNVGKTFHKHVNEYSVEDMEDVHKDN